MSIKILTKNSIDNTNIDGARQNHFSAGMRSGIVKGAFNEGKFFASAPNIIALDSCELRISGHQVVIYSTETITLNDRPSTPTKYSMIAEIQVSDASVPSFRLFIQPANLSLRQDNLFKTNNGSGTYQLRIGNFTLGTTGLISDVIRTADIITGGGEGGIADIEFNATATQLSSSSQPTANIDYNEETGEYDAHFGIPAGSGSKVTIGGVEQPTWSADFAESERQKSKNLFDYTKIKSLSYGITQADGIFTINTQFYYPAINYDINLNQGETYTFSLNIDSYSNSDGSGVNSELVLFSATGQPDTKGVGGVSNIGRYSMTFTPSFDVVSIEIRPIRKSNNTSTLTGTVSNLMLCVGEDSDYQPYNGAIVHEKDIADVEHIETIYDVTNTRLNMGYSSGINGDLGTDIPYDFTKYKKVIATCCTEDIDNNQYSAMFSFELDLFKKTTNSTHPYRAIATVLNPDVVMSATTTTQLVCAIFEIGYSKTYFTYKAYLKNGENLAGLLSSAKLIKLEGVY